MSLPLAILKGNYELTRKIAIVLPGLRKVWFACMRPKLNSCYRVTDGTDQSSSPVCTRSPALPGKLVAKASLFTDIATAREEVFEERKISWV